MDGSNALEQLPTPPEESLGSIQQGVDGLKGLLKQLNQISGAPVPSAPGEEKPTTS